MDRWEQKNKVIKAFDKLIQEMEDYLAIWKKTGGGTTGFFIGSMINNLKSLKNKWSSRA
ncbi:hypothetical protein [Nonlabens sp. MIC269]|uniref:hypothetical protein n=1 Tax=Nonlabens sp. MIC269 TaxID=1476901 RepID=UPI000A838DED|nr:hypothetical protein [Nonlabens sp. MIC269]